MALLWRDYVDGHWCEVRSAGASRRLYTDGVLHSQYNPRHVWTGGVWDLLTLPIFFLPPSARRSALVLGVGGGAVIHQLMAFCRPEKVVGVDLSRTYLDLAQQFFGLDYPRLQLHCQDARDWVEQTPGQAFDLIVEDLYGQADGEPQRGMELTPTWVTAMARQLHPQGALVVNCVEPAQVRQLCQSVNRCPARLGFRAAYRFQTSGYGNQVVALVRRSVTVYTLRANLRAHRESGTRRKSCRLDYSALSLGRFFAGKLGEIARNTR